MENKKEKKVSNIKARKKLDYIADSQDTVADESPRFAYFVGIVILLVIIFSFVWAALSNLEVVTNAEGRVDVSDQLQVIENLEGGIVKKIDVREGQTVKKGQLLIELDNTRFASDHLEGVAKLRVLEAEKIRLNAEANGESNLVFSEQFTKENPKLVANTIQLFNSNTKALNDTLAILNQNYALMQKELNIIRPLAKSGVMSNVDLIRLERQSNDLSTQMLEKKETVRQNARDGLNKINAEYAMLKEHLKGTKDRLDRANIYSPVDGDINQLYVTTIGEVVQAGHKILDIVPTGNKFTIRVNLRPNDVGFIHPGQEALIKVSAYDFSIYGGLAAKVKEISPDSIVDDKGMPFYVVKLQTDKNNLIDKDGKPLKIMAGMTVTASIITGHKSILNYILKPFYKAKYTALRER